MLSAVLKSQRAVQMSVLIVRAFVKMRELLASHKDLAARIEKLEASQQHHASVINLLADEIDELKQPSPVPPKRRMGFHSKETSKNSIAKRSAQNDGRGLVSIPGVCQGLPSGVY